jgi:thiamine biosynthesis lipoprotein
MPNDTATATPLIGRSDVPLPASMLGGLLAKRSFRAMNTSVEITLQDWRYADRLGGVERYFGAFERRFSRFQSNSELSGLNASAGRETQVSGEMLALLAEAVRLHEVTGGVFDPAVLTALEAAGYDRTFDDVDRHRADAPTVGIPLAPTFGQVAIEAVLGVVTLPRGMRIDFGGIGKGFAVDGAAEMLRGAGPALINAGGDLFGRGDGPYGDGWLISVTNADRMEIDRVILHDEAVATSTVALRRWRRAGRPMHHLIDPQTGQPASTGLTSVTVIARTATDADVFAKTALILGIDKGRTFLQEQDAQALFVTDCGEIIATERWPGSARR